MQDKSRFRTSRSNPGGIFQRLAIPSYLLIHPRRDEAPISVKRSSHQLRIPTRYALSTDEIVATAAWREQMIGAVPP